jgi:hypothetical protein
MPEMFTEHQVRSGIVEAFEVDDAAVNDAIEVMRATPRAPGALGFSAEELSGTRAEPCVPE